MRRPALVLLAALAAALSTGAATAAPPPAIQRQQAREHAVLARIDAIGRNLEQVIQDWDGARIRLRTVERNLQLNEYALRVARSNLQASRQRLAARLYSLYVDGQPSTLDVLAGAKSLSGVLDRLESQRVLSKQDAAIGLQTLRFTGSVQRREKLLRIQKRQRAATVARIGARKRTIETALAEQQRLLASIHKTLAGLQAQEAARERRLAALQRARIARAIAAHAASLQDAPPTQTPGLVPSPVTSAIGTAAGGHPEAAQVAARYLGVPYVWGGASPAGFDCSGLVMYVYAQLGISLPHYTVDQWNATLPISTSDLAPGDLVFFDGLGHVGIYIGGGQFIHAPHTGTVVQVSSLYGWGGTFYGARRVP